VLASYDHAYLMICPCLHCHYSMFNQGFPEWTSGAGARNTRWVEFGHSSGL